MNLAFFGRADNIGDAEMVAVLEWAATMLLGRRMTRFIYVDLAFISPREMKRTEMPGAVALVDYSLTTRNRARNFTIDIDKTLSKTDMIRTIIHEMVHVKQYARKELRNFGLTSSWKGKQYDTLFLPIQDRPWEQEAYALENSLYMEYMKEKNR